jgi:hypothetical protein
LLFNFGKLVTNLVFLTIRIENQRRFPGPHVIVLPLPVVSVTYISGIQKFIALPLTAVKFSLFLFVFATATIAFATIVFGVSVILRPIPLAGFLTWGIGEVIIIVTVIGFRCLPVQTRAQSGMFEHFSPAICTSRTAMKLSVPRFSLLIPPNHTRLPNSLVLHQNI